MGRSRGSRSAWFRVSLRAVEELWSGGPGLIAATVRFGFVGSWQPPETVEAGGGPFRTICLQVLAQEMPYSVIPFWIQDAFAIRRSDPPPD